MELSEEFMKNLRVRVDKKVADDRNSLCGQPLQPGGKYGHGFFIVPAHQREHFKNTYLHYEVSAEFIPDTKSVEVPTAKEPELADISCEYPGCTFTTKYQMALTGHQRSHPDMAKHKKDALKGFERKRGPKPKAKEPEVEEEQVMV